MALGSRAGARRCCPAPPDDAAERLVPHRVRARQPGHRARSASRRRDGVDRGQRRHGPRRRRRVLRPAVRGAARLRRRRLGVRSPTGRAIPTSCSTVRAPRWARCSRSSPRVACNVRGLLWRSHPEAMNFGEGKNLAFSRAINEAGGRCCSTSGSVAAAATTRSWSSMQHARSGARRRVRRRASTCATAGATTHRHLGDPQVVELDDQHYGERPPWHDLQLEVRGPAVDDLAFTFAERWTRSQPARLPQPGAVGAPPGGRAIPTPRARSPPSRPAPTRRPARGPGAAHLPGSPARVPVRARGRAQHRPRLPQGVLAAPGASSTSRTSTCGRWPRPRPCATRCARQPRAADRGRDPALSPIPTARSRARRAASVASGCSTRCTTVGHDRVAVYDLENGDGHADLRALQGVHRRRRVDGGRLRQPQPPLVDARLRALVCGDRQPARRPCSRPIPAGLGDGAAGARARARGCASPPSTSGVRPTTPPTWSIPQSWFEALRKGADALDAWHRFDGIGDRPPGHLREHPIERVRGSRRWGRGLAHATLLDPDGRPRHLRRTNEF